MVLQLSSELIGRAQWTAHALETYTVQEQGVIGRGRKAICKGECGLCLGGDLSLAAIFAPGERGGGDGGGDGGGESSPSSLDALSGSIAPSNRPSSWGGSEQA